MAGSRIKHVVKSLAYRASCIAGLSQRVIRRLDAAAILMYHRILPGRCPADWPFPSLVVDTDSFSLQMRWLARQFHVCTVSDLLAETVRPEKPRAVVTFDDGYSDNVLHAAPLLEEVGIRGTFFVTTGFIGENKRLWFDVAARMAAASGSFKQRMSRWKSMNTAERRDSLNRLTHPGDWCAPERDRAMTVADLQRLANTGHEIGVHTRTHPILTMVEPTELTSEIAGSVSDLKAWGIAPRGIAYPNGDYSETVIAESRRAGLNYGLSTSLGWYCQGENAFSIPRIDVNMLRLTGWHKDPVEGLKAELTWLGIKSR